MEIVRCLSGYMSSSGVDGLALLTSREASSVVDGVNAAGGDATAPDIELRLQNALLTTATKERQQRESVQRQLNVRADVMQALFTHAPSAHGFRLEPTLLRPRSTGTVRLTSRDLKAPPAIDPRYLSHHRDVEVLLKGTASVSVYRKCPSTSIWCMLINKNDCYFV